ncbi:AAA family ATPase [Pelagicoccus mobilis]|uniref:AAA family ATPase n=1 Tax=Pelagicoccus mobilis TaxID=415221 RepID=A0A934VPF5_9BACT|nr:AAA family ATPase [Pelagicoccus mobilis]MBK1875765.1 AAA family ATPase [Pelagicoccus mobilis]
MNRIYVFGASGTGTTTLAVGFAEQSQCYHLDTDDFYWEKTDPPYKSVVPHERRIDSIKQQLDPHENWVLSGCMCSWGSPILKLTTLAVFISLPWGIRRRRLREREKKRFGDDCLDSGGFRVPHFQEFEDWAQSYDSADASMRSRLRHELWIKAYEEKGGSVIRMEQDETIEVRLRHLFRAVGTKNRKHNQMH